MIELANVTVAFDGQVVLDRLSLSMRDGEFVYLVGATGAGKSSLLRLLYMDLKPDSGSVKVLNYDAESTPSKDIPRLRRKLGIVFQDFKLLEDRDVNENVAFALYVTNASRSEITKRVLHALADAEGGNTPWGFQLENRCLHRKHWRRAYRKFDRISSGMAGMWNLSVSQRMVSLKSD